MVEARHSKKGPRHAPRKKEEVKTTWSKLKGSALFWLAMVVVFAFAVVGFIIFLSALLSNSLGG